MSRTVSDETCVVAFWTLFRNAAKWTCVVVLGTPLKKQPEAPDSLDDIASEEEVHSNNAWESGIGCIHVWRDGRHKECQNCRRATCQTK